jgi:hypothetical protein
LPTNSVAFGGIGHESVKAEHISIKREETDRIPVIFLHDD